MADNFRRIREQVEVEYDQRLQELKEYVVGSIDAFCYMKGGELWESAVRYARQGWSGQAWKRDHLEPFKR